MPDPTLTKLGNPDARADRQAGGVRDGRRGPSGHAQLRRVHLPLPDHQPAGLGDDRDQLRARRADRREQERQALPRDLPRGGHLPRAPGDDDPGRLRGGPRPAVARGHGELQLARRHRHLRAELVRPRRGFGASRPRRGSARRPGGPALDERPERDRHKRHLELADELPFQNERSWKASCRKIRLSIAAPTTAPHVAAIVQPRRARGV